MAVHSGKDGSVKVSDSPEAAVQDWEVDDATELHPYHTNDSGASRQRCAGVKDWTGSFNMLDKPSFVSGASIEFAGYTDQDILSGTALVQSIRVRDPIEGGEPVSYAVTIGGHGDLEWTTGSA